MCVHTGPSLWLHACTAICVSVSRLVPDARSAGPVAPATCSAFFAMLASFAEDLAKAHQENDETDAKASVCWSL